MQLVPNATYVRIMGETQSAHLIVARLLRQATWRGGDGGDGRGRVVRVARRPLAAALLSATSAAPLRALNMSEVVSAMERHMRANAVNSRVREVETVSGDTRPVSMIIDESGAFTHTLTLSHMHMTPADII